jgi:hypothetical protein
MPLTGAGEGKWPETNIGECAPEDGSHFLEEFVTSGILWAINEEMFWPYGAALAFHTDDKGKICGWSLQPSPDGKRVDIPKEVKDRRWAAYMDTCTRLLGWEAGW